MLRKYARVDRGRVVEFFNYDGNIEDMFGVDQPWYDVTDEDPPVEIGWAATEDGGVWSFAPYVPSYQELVTSATAERNSRLRIANDRLIIQPLQFKVDLAIATPGEEALLQLWKEYCAGVASIEAQPGYPGQIIWPTSPDEL